MWAVLGCLASLFTFSSPIAATGVSSLSTERFHLVSDINLTGQSGASRNGSGNDLVIFDNRIYFVGENDGLGSELWSTDGTESDTTLVKDVFTGFRSSDIDQLTPVGTLLYFIADDGIHGRELWVTNGTSAGTRLVKDIHPVGSGGPDRMGSHNGFLYFGADSTGNGHELWKSDGTESGTQRVADIATGGINPNSFVSIGSNLYFVSYGADAEVLRKIDSSNVIVNLHTNARSNKLIAIGGTLYFAGEDNVTGLELWKTNGTQSGTVLVEDINVGTGDSNPSSFTSLGNVLFFTAGTLATGPELWKSDGTEAGTLLVKDIHPSIGFPGPTNLTAVGDVLYFTADDASSGYELWKSDGTLAGTSLVKDINAGSETSSPYELTAFDNRLYFAADDGANGVELWKSNGTDVGTTRVKNINPEGSSGVDSLIALGSTLYFVANDGQRGLEVWKSTGTTVGTTLVRYLGSGTADAAFGEFTELGGFQYFAASDGVSGRELWRTDGSEAGTNLVEDINPGFAGSNPSSLITRGNFVYFSASNGSGGDELWKTDGTATTQVSNTNLGSAFYPALIGDDLYFTSAETNSLWKLDEDDVLLELQDGSRPFAFNGEVFFNGRSTDGIELWKTDGSVSGTALVKNINPLVIASKARSSHPGEFTPFGNFLYFTADDGTTGREIWRPVISKLSELICSSSPPTATTLSDSGRPTALKRHGFRESPVLSR